MGVGGFGILMAVWGAGMALGALVVGAALPAAARWRAWRSRPSAAQGLGIAVPALWPMVWLAIAGYLFGGVAHGDEERARAHAHPPCARRSGSAAARSRRSTGCATAPSSSR